MAFSWLPTLFVILAAVIQAVVIVLSRKYAMAFWVLAPLVLLHQYFFLTAYTKAENFVFIWFFAAAFTSILALFVGQLIFHDVVSLKNYIGIILIALGIALTKL